MTQTADSPVVAFFGLVPGIYRGIEAAQYHDALAVSSSVLKRLHCFSPAHAFDMVTNGIEPTDEMDIGSAAHCLLFTPSEFGEQFFEAPFCQAIKKDGELCRHSAIGQFEGKWRCGVHSKGLESNAIELTIMSADDMARVKGICAAVRSHPVAADILDAATDHELSIIAKDPETGLTLKSRMDIWCAGINTMPDLKTCRSSDPKRFKYQARDLGYHIQMAFYRHVAALAGLDVQCTSIIACENTSPFAVTVFEPSGQFLETGGRDMLAALSAYAQCKESGRWPSYAETTQLLDLP